MAFNRNNLNLGNQFSHAAEVARGEARESNNRSRPYYKIPSGMKSHKWTAKEERFNILLAKNNATDSDITGYKFYKAVPIHELPNLADPKHPHRYPCLKILGKPCPCCERKDQLDDGSKGGENWARIKPFIPKDRVLYYFNPEGTSDILVHECAAKQTGESAFPQRLMAQATAMGNGGLPLSFAAPTADGSIIKVNTAKNSYEGNEYYAPSAVNFFPRKELPADELYDRCVPWNEILNFGTYEEMERVMNGGEPDDFGDTNQNEHTEEQKQAEFERACEESVPRNNGFKASEPQQNPDNGFRTSPEQSTPRGFTTSPAGGQPVQCDFPSEPVNSQAGGCPNGLKFGSDFESSRKCCNCNAYEACRNARRNGN